MYENESAWFKVVVTDGVLVLLLELAGGGEAAGKDVVVDGGEVSGAFLELAGTNG